MRIQTCERPGKRWDKAPKRGAVERRVLENAEQFNLLGITTISTSEILLISANGMLLSILSRCPFESVLDKHFFKSDLLANEAVWILCRWVGAEKRYMHFSGWYSEIGC